MDNIVKINNVEFQNIICVTHETNNDFKNGKLKTNVFEETINEVTKTHFSKLYDHIYRDSKFLTNELTKISRQHFLNSTANKKKRFNLPSLLPFTPGKLYPTATTSNYNKDRRNLSFLESPIQKIIDIPKKVNISVIESEANSPINKKEAREKRFIPKCSFNQGDKSPFLQSLISGKELADGILKAKLPHIPLQNFSSGEQTKRSQIEISELATPFIKEGGFVSREITPKGERISAIFMEKHREKLNKSKAEKLMNVENADFIKLARMIAGENKQTQARFIKLTREQLKIHLLKKYPPEIADRFIKIMDFPTSFDLKTYLDYFKSLLTDSLDFPYFVCFYLFDFYNDDILNHRDIFVLLKLVEEYPVLQKDFFKLLNRPDKSPGNKFAQLTAKHFLKNGINTTKASGAISPSIFEDNIGFRINKKALAQKITVLKNIENIIFKQKDMRIINLTQLRMIHQTELNTYLNFKRGKYRYKSLIDMISNSTFQSKKSNLANQENIGGTRASLNPQPSSNNIGDKNSDISKSKKVLSKIFSKHHMEVISKWGETGVDILGFAEIFSDDIPFLLRDIFFYCTLIEIPGYNEKFNVFEVFDLYRSSVRLGEESQSRETNSTFYNTTMMKDIRTIESGIPRLQSIEDYKPSESENNF